MEMRLLNLLLFLFLKLIFFLILDKLTIFSISLPLITIKVGACFTSYLAVISVSSSASTKVYSIPALSNIVLAILQLGQVFVPKRINSAFSSFLARVFFGLISTVSSSSITSSILICSSFSSVLPLKQEPFKSYNFLCLYSCVLPAFQFLTGL